MDSTDTTVKKLSMTRDAIRKREKRYLEGIKRENEAFAKLEPAQQRVAIAKDVLKWIDIGKITATSGTYLDIESDEHVGVYKDVLWTDAYYRGEIDAQEAFLRPGAKCNVCALGGLFACTVARANNIDLRAVNNAGQSRMHEYLAPYFSERQLILIESAFERSDFRRKDEKYKLDQYGEYQFVPDPEVERAVHLAYASDPDDRMIAIMNNIIANGGEFRP
jgi:hypothetical protein